MLPFEESLLDTHRLIDVRTPLEFAEDHIPGAVNAPLLSNEERVEIGIIYKQSGPHAARQRGLELTSPRFPLMVREIESYAGDRPVLVYCWRGGLRSKTVTSILDLTGHRAFQLQGGYKSYRNHIVSYFDNFVPTGPLVVLHGLTGIGKTQFIHSLCRKIFTVVDLEGLACHRGSAFGELGLSQALTQKCFESLLWDEFRKGVKGRPVILEGESRRIGRISLPGNVYEVMKGGIKVWCHATLDTRVGRLIEEYGKREYQSGMSEALSRIRGRLGGDRYDEIAGYLDRWEMKPFMAQLLESYYDKVYYKTRDWQEDLAISLEDYESACRQLEEFLDKLPLRQE
jgi:tRNA 2-selenouridine synthase